MSKEHGIWNILLPLSVVFLGAAYYIKVPSVRQAIDARTDVPGDLLSRFIQKQETLVVKREPPPYTPIPRDEPSMPRRSSEAVESAAPSTPPPATPALAPAVFDLQKLSADPSRWPKKVALAKPATFAAMLNGKPVGSIVVPAGSEATLKAIQDGKLGLEFNGGGAWLAVEDTDLVKRVMAP